MAESIRPYIVINGKSSREVSGLLIVSLPPISKPQMRVTAEEIDGRDGDIVTELGFSAYDKPVEIGLAGDYDINEVISYFNQAGIITFSNEPDKYYKFAQYNGIDFEKLIRFKTATVIFHVQPFKYDTESNDAVFWNPENISITNEGNIYSKPELAIQGSGNVGIALNGSEVLSLELGETKQAIIIDTDKMNAYGTKSNVKELITDINPVQDLHGYDSVWIGGAGKNLFNDTTGTHTINANTDVTIIIGDVYLEANTTYTISCKQTPAPLASFVRNIMLVAGGGTTTYNSAGNDYTIKPMTFTPTVSGIYSIRVWGHTLPVDTTYSDFQVEKGSTATEWTPYENICDISGWNGCVVSRTGKNLFNKETATTGAWVNAIGTTNVGANRAYSDFISIALNVPYYFSNVEGNSTFTTVIVYDREKNIIGTKTLSGSGIVSGSITFTEGYYIRVNTNEDVLDIVQIELGDTATSYEKFVGSKYQKFFEGLMAGTYSVVDLGSLDWISEDNVVSGLARVNQNQVISLGAKYFQTPICTQFNGVYPKSYVNFNNGEIGFSNFEQLPLLRARSTEFVGKTNAEITALMSGVYLIYELETATAPTITQPDINGLISDFGADLNAIVFGQTVFGGTLNVTTGLLTVTKIAHIFDGSENFLTLANGRVFAYDFGVNLVGSYHNNNSLCSHFHEGYGAWDQLGVGEYLIAGVRYGGVNPDMTLADYRTYLQAQYNNGTPVTLVATLANPTEIQLTAEEIQTLIGNNNIWSNTGDISECIYTRAGADVTTSGAIVSFEADASDLRDDILKNRLVTGNYDNLRLKAGANQIGISGDVDVLVLSNFSRWL